MNIPLPTPRVLPISKKVSTSTKQLEILDPLVVELAVAGAVDESYLIMLNELENGLRGKELGEDSELRKIEGILDNLGVITLPDGNRLIVRGGLEILVPESQRKRILSTLHLDHSSDENMIRQVKNKLFWPKLRNDLKKTYEGCPECTQFRISHPQKSNEVSYRNIFSNFYPNQLPEVDFAQKG